MKKILKTLWFENPAELNVFVNKNEIQKEDIQAILFNGKLYGLFWWHWYGNENIKD